MKLILAKSAGFCFGVSRAVNMAYDSLSNHDNIYTLGPIIHNPQVVDELDKKGVKVITVTENLESPLALGADVVLKQYVNRETDKYNSQGTTSSTALCMIFHALQTALIEETDYKNEQFALIHPGGAVGERLNKK